MNKSKVNIKDNVRHISILKKTASRICSTQVLYGSSFVESDIDLLIKSYMANYLELILIELADNLSIRKSTASLSKQEDK